MEICSVTPIPSFVAGFLATVEKRKSDLLLECGGGGGGGEMRRFDWFVNWVLRRESTIGNREQMRAVAK